MSLDFILLFGALSDRQAVDRWRGQGEIKSYWSWRDISITALWSSKQFNLLITLTMGQFSSSVPSKSWEWANMHDRGKLNGIQPSFIWLLWPLCFSSTVSNCLLWKRGYCCGCPQCPCIVLHSLLNFKETQQQWALFSSEQIQVSVARSGAHKNPHPSQKLYF